MNQKITKLTYFRLCLCGAIAGTALFGTVGPLFGIDPTHIKDAVGGGFGASAVAIGFKLARWA